MFDKERDMQAWVYNEIIENEGLHSLIDNINDVMLYDAKSDQERKIKNSFLNSYRAVEYLEVISDDKNISTDDTEILKPDILALSIEHNTFVIVELKNNSSASRQAGTELSAYSAELKGSLDYLSDGDIISVIISTDWRPLLLHHVFNMINWQHKNILCLEPKLNDLGGKVLKILPIGSIIKAKTRDYINQRHLTGFNVTLYDFDATDSHESFLSCGLVDSNLLRIKAFMGLISSFCERNQAHGFCRLDFFHSVNGGCYVLTMVNASGVLAYNNFAEEHDMDSILISKLYELDTKHTFSSSSRSLFDAYANSREILSSFSKPQIETLTTWDNLRINAEAPHMENVFIELWGFYNDRFNEYIIENSSMVFDEQRLLLVKQCVIDAITREIY